MVSGAFGKDPQAESKINEKYQYLDEETAFLQHTFFTSVLI